MQSQPRTHQSKTRERILFSCGSSSLPFLKKAHQRTSWSCASRAAAALLACSVARVASICHFVNLSLPCQMDAIVDGGTFCLLTAIKTPVRYVGSVCGLLTAIRTPIWYVASVCGSSVCVACGPPASHHQLVAQLFVCGGCIQFLGPRQVFCMLLHSTTRLVAESF